MLMQVQSLKAAHLWSTVSEQQRFASPAALTSNKINSTICEVKLCNYADKQKH